MTEEGETVHEPKRGTKKKGKNIVRGQTDYTSSNFCLFLSFERETDEIGFISRRSAFVTQSESLGCWSAGVLFGIQYLYSTSTAS